MTRKFTCGALALSLLFAASSASAQTFSRRHDLVIPLAPGSLAALVLDGVPGIAVVQAGELSLRIDGDSTCAANPTSGCPAVLNILKVRVNDLAGLQLNVDGDIDIIDVTTPVNVVSALNPVPHDGFDFVMPAGLSTSTFGKIFGEIAGQDFNGESLLRGSTLPAGLTVAYSLVPTQLAAIDGALPVSLHIGNSDIGGSLSLMASGSTPFTNTPPLAFAGANITATCGQAVTLDGTQTIDQEGNNTITAYRWYDETNTLLASTATTQVTLPTGVHTLKLEVEDSTGAIGRDFVQVTVDGGSSTPTFTFVPPTVTASQCGPVSIGQATAKTLCGTVAVTSNAPASFYAGRTTVTWTATPTQGQPITATQTVIVELGNNAACCPPGTTVIQGNASNNTLNGTNGPDCILGFGGQDTINGNGGDDIISAGDGNDVVNGGSGNDVMSGGTGQDQLYGGIGNDLASGNDGDDLLQGNDGDDILKGGQGQDNVYGGNGADSCLGGTGDDHLFGEAGDDLLDGDEHNNQCTGGAGFDTILHCSALDPLESSGQPPIPPDPSYNVCSCKANKCNDCTAQIASCQAASGCSPIIQCVQNTSSCNLPHECSATCESGRSPEAINAARQLASCFGGC